MFGLFGHQEIIQDVYRISAPFAGSHQVKSTEDLRTCFHDFLESHQPYMPVNRAEDFFITEPDVEEALIRAYSFNNTLDDLRQTQVIGEPYAQAEKREKIEFARDALADLFDRDEYLASIFSLVIHSIVVRPSTRGAGRASYGGSSSAAIGTIWLSLGPTVTRLDVTEMFLHELTHHLLFIDERNFAHFDYGQIADCANYAFSAILNLQRPIDKVFHSIVVASELIMGRRSFLPSGQTTIVHPATAKMVSDTQKALQAVYSLERCMELLKPRGHEILARCAQRCGFDTRH